MKPREVLLVTPVTITFSNLPRSSRKSGNLICAPGPVDGVSSVLKFSSEEYSPNDDYSSSHNEFGLGVEEQD
jgi:hypothetical protein